MLNIKWKRGLRTGWAVALIAAGLAVGATAGLASKALAGPSGTAAALADCMTISKQAAEFGSGVSLIKAEQSTAAEVAAWQEHRYDKVPGGTLTTGISSRFRDMAAATPVAVCLYTGQFVTPVGPPNPDGTNRPPHNVLRLLVPVGGPVVLDSAGYAGGSMRPETPRDWALSMAP